jgi:uncharacterized membrane protein YdfJ with MMPL/SSD domain
VLGFYALCLVLGLWQGLQMPGLASNLFTPLRGTRGAAAADAIAQHWPSFANAQPWTVLIECEANRTRGCLFDGPNLDRAVATLVNDLNATLRSWLAERGLAPWEVMSYSRYAGTALEAIGAGFVSADATATIATIAADAGAKQTLRYALYAVLARRIDDVSPPGFAVGLTGLDCIVADANAVVMANLDRADGVSIPVAFLILAAMVRSWRILLIAAFNLGVVILGAFALMVLLIKTAHVQSQSMMTQFMSVMGLAMSIDYSLFIFSRLREELAEEHCAVARAAAAAARGGAAAEEELRGGGAEGGDGEARRAEHAEATGGAPPRCDDVGVACADATLRCCRSPRCSACACCAPLASRCADSLCRSRLSVRRVEAALARAMLRGGHVVLMSGSTLIVSFLGYLVVQNAILTQAGVGVGTTVALSIVVNLTATPCFVLTLPGFFTRFAPVGEWLCLPALRRAAQRGARAGRARLDRARAASAPSRVGVASSTLQQPMLSSAQESSFVANARAQAKRDAAAAAPTAALAPMASRGMLRPRHETRALLSPLALAEQRRTTCWWRVSALLTRWPYNLLVMVVLWFGAGALCVAVHVWSINLTDNFRSGMPATSHAMQTFDRLAADFSAGATLPFYLLLVAPALAGPGARPTPAAAFAQQEEFFAASATLFTALTDPESARAVATGLRAASFVGATLNAAAAQPASGAALSLSGDEACLLRSISPVYRYAWGKFVERGAVGAPGANASAASSACGAAGPVVSAITVVSVETFDPASNAVKGWVAAMRAVIDGDVRSALPPGYEVRFGGYKVAEVDSVNHAVARFPAMVVVTVGLAFVIVGVFMRSIFMPLRLLLTLAVPLAAVYSLAMLVYQIGAFEWAWNGAGLERGLGAVPPMFADVGGFYWSIPIICFAITIGLALDYDVFLIQRIAENRRRGIHVRWAVPLAVSQTGSLITAAGVIMAVAFGSLLFMDSMAARQMGFILVSSVLFDTFVVRTLLVPAVMSMTDCFGWWPGKVPRRNLTDDAGRPVDDRTGALLNVAAGLPAFGTVGIAQVQQQR